MRACYKERAVPRGNRPTREPLELTSKRTQAVSQITVLFWDTCCIRTWLVARCAYARSIVLRHVGGSVVLGAPSHLSVRSCWPSPCPLCDLWTSALLDLWANAEDRPRPAESPHA
jgi:hypothetical protein